MSVFPKFVEVPTLDWQKTVAERDALRAENEALRSALQVFLHETDDATYCDPVAYNARSKAHAMLAERTP